MENGRSILVIDFGTEAFQLSSQVVTACAVGGCVGYTRAEGCLCLDVVIGAVGLERRHLHLLGRALLFCLIYRALVAAASHYRHNQHRDEW